MAQQGPQSSGSGDFEQFGVQGGARQQGGQGVQQWGQGRQSQQPQQGYGQQSQQPQQDYGQSFQQPPQFQQQSQQMGLRLQEALSDEMRVALDDLIQSMTACDWCAEQCIDEGPEMAECIRLCRDVSDLAALNAKFVARDSVFGPEAIEVFASAAQACAQECARHSHAHCQECAEVLSRAVQSTQQMLTSFGQAGGQFQQGQIGQMGAGSQGQQGQAQVQPGGTSIQGQPIQSSFQGQPGQTGFQGQQGQQF